MSLAKLRIRVVEMRFRPTVRASPKALRVAMVGTAAAMEQATKRKIDKPYPPASMPGRPPHRRSGRLHNELSIRAEGKTIKVRVPQYGVWLEGGTRKMAPRPYIRSTLHAQRRRWGKMITRLAKAEMAKTAKKKQRR